MAINGFLHGKEKGCVVTTVLEHPSVSGPLKKYADMGIEIIELPVDTDGIMSPIALKETLDKREDIHLVAIQHANHEIGVVQDIQNLGAVHYKNANDALMATVGSLMKRT